MEESEKSGTPIEWLMPLAFILTFGWMTWHAPAYVLDMHGYTDELFARFKRVDLTPNLPGLFGGYGDIVDYGAMLLSPIILFFGMKTVRRAPMEFEDWRKWDRLSVFIGRVVMMLIVLLTSVMLYEVILRYVFEAPTLWANEMSLWLAGYVFLCSGLYAMQQRSHIRIFLLYDMMPRFFQRFCDVLSTAFIVLFAFFLVYGGYGEAFDKFLRWETFGTAFDPPIPATIKPMVLFIITMVAVQAVLNLIADWNLEPVIHTAADDIDEDELARLRAAVGADGTGDLDVTRGSIQSNTPRKHD